MAILLILLSMAGCGAKKNTISEAVTSDDKVTVGEIMVTDFADNNGNQIDGVNQCGNSLDAPTQKDDSIRYGTNISSNIFDYIYVFAKISSGKAGDKLVVKWFFKNDSSGDGWEQIGLENTEVTKACNQELIAALRVPNAIFWNHYSNNPKLQDETFKVAFYSEDAEIGAKEFSGVRVN